MTYDEAKALGLYPPKPLPPPRNLTPFERVETYLECAVDWSGFLADGLDDWYISGLILWRELHEITVPVHIYGQQQHQPERIAA